ncbi:MAG: uroporphyrinogen-III synthase [Marinicellaceae bacterium]
MSVGTILNTRPIAYKSQTHKAFHKKGFSIIDFPCIEIAAPNDMNQVKNQLNDIKSKGIIVFTSPQAVRFAFKIKSEWKIPQPILIIAVGPKTAEMLEQYTSHNIFTPEQHNSHGVIELIQGLNYSDSMTLICAKGGRQRIKKFALDNRINFSQINVYQRKIPSNVSAFDWIDCDNLNVSILATSINSLDNLKILTGKSHWLKLKDQLLVCASKRIETHAHEIGCLNTLNTNSANPKVMSNKLAEHIKKTC